MRGLPQKEAYETVLRDGLTVDSFDPAGIYLGTRSGQLFNSRDDGKTWHKIHDGLPSIVCVRTAMIDDGSTMPVQAPKAPRPTASSKTSRVSKSSRDGKNGKSRK